MSQTYRLVDEGRAIRCLICGTTSHNPHDVSHRYCGFCRCFHEDAENIERLRRAIQHAASLKRPEKT